MSDNNSAGVIEEETVVVVVEEGATTLIVPTNTAGYESSTSTKSNIDTATSVNDSSRTPADSSEQAEKPTDSQDEVGNAATEDGAGKGWESSASLYCRRNGRSHAALLEFGITTCPICDQDLTANKNLDLESESSTSSDSDAEEEVVKDENEQMVTYSLEYRDSGDNYIATVPWPRLFDLSAARKGIDLKERIIFEVVTVLDTSIPSDGHRYRSEKDDLLEEGIVDNPKIKVAVRFNRMTIHSNRLIKAIAQVVTYYPSEKLEGEFIEVAEPYPLLVHYMEELEAYRATYIEPDFGSPIRTEEEAITTHPACDKETSNHVGILLDFLRDSIYQTHIKDEEARHARLVCTFRMLWLLFKPGKTVYMESNGQLSAYVIQAVDFGNDILSTTIGKWPKPYIIDLWNLDFDGRFVGRSSVTVTIPHFDGERQIKSLKIFPCEFVDREDGGETRRKMEVYGKYWYELLQGRQIFYSGESMDDSKRWFEGRVYVDSAAYFYQRPSEAPEICDIDDMGEGLANCSCEECHGRIPHPRSDFRWARYDVLDPKVQKDLEDPGSPEGPRHRYLLCNRLLHGFVLKSRSWEKLNVANCLTPKSNTKAIDNLVMPEARKDMIKALVQKFSESGRGEKTSKSWGADFIENKGEGQIFLLHGSPGVGKTFTAECIAEYTGRALLSLTCGDIGTDEVKMEEQLSKWFRLAEKWGAVMLIDEADVYLERRQITDLKRNSLVSVFLRCIEYYRGILFLTTNRVGHFDDAFISRIHVIIRYENLKEDDRKKIWEQFFDKLTDERDDFTVTRRAKSYVLEDEIISKMEWNGREIRNAFQTAVSLAEYRFAQKPEKAKDDGPTLDQKDFEQVCNMTRDFKQYLVNVHGVDEEERAFRAKARASHGG